MKARYAMALKSNAETVVIEPADPNSNPTEIMHQLASSVTGDF